MHHRHNGTERCSELRVVWAEVLRWTITSLWRFRWVLLATTIVLVAAVSLVVYRNAARQSAQQIACKNNLVAIGIAFLNYSDAYGAFPPAVTYADDGTPMHSWRVLVLPITAGNPGKRFLRAYNFAKPWNSSENLCLADDMTKAYIMRSVYQCPLTRKSEDLLHTSYVMLIDDRPGSPNGPPSLPGGVPPRLEGERVIVIEIADTDIHWMQPRDVLLSELSLKVNDRAKRSISSLHVGGAFVLMADGTVQFLDEQMTEERLRAMLSPRIRESTPERAKNPEQRAEDGRARESGEKRQGGR